MTVDLLPPSVRLIRTASGSKGCGQFLALGKARIRVADGDVSLNNGALTRVPEFFQPASDEAEHTVFENLIWQTKARHGDAIGLEMDDLLILVNRDMAIAIDREELKLRGLFNAATRKEFVSISEASPPRDLVNLTLLTPDHLEFDASGFTEPNIPINGGRPITVSRWCCDGRALMCRRNQM